MSDNSSNPQRGQYDPGWNDPPKLQYNSSTNQAGKTKLNLNKRIAFPLQSSSAVNTSKPTAIVQPSPSLLPLTSLASANTQSTLSPAALSQPPIAIVPPMPQSNPPPPMQRVPPLDSTISSSNNSNNISRNQQTRDNQDNIELNENAREYCLSVFQRFIPRIQESTNVRSDEVQRRISLMNQMWLSHTLTSSVQRKLYKIAKALETSNFNDAIENHRALVVDHSNVCAAWGAALRQIILTIPQNQDNRNLLDGGINAPATATSNIGVVGVGNVLATSIGDSSMSETGIASTSDIVQSQNEPSNDIQHI